MCFLGFYVNEEQQYNMPLLLAIVIILNVILWLVSFGKRTMAGGVIGFVAAIVIAFVYLSVSGNMLTAFTDTEDSPNPYLYYMICFAVIVGVWLLASTRRGTLVLMPLGALVAALIQYLYHNNHFLWLALFLIACMVNLALKNYQNQVLRFGNRNSSFGRTALVALVCVLAAFLIGTGAFYGIVSPLNPPAKKLELFTRDMTRTPLDRMGLASEVKVLDPDQKSDVTEEVPGVSGTESSEASGNDDDGGIVGDEIDEDSEMDNAANLFSEDSEDDQLDAISYNRLRSVLWTTILLIAILAAAAIILKVLSHRMWLKRIQDKSQKEQISAMYHLFLRKFAQIKEGKYREETPYEYAERTELNLASFVTQEADFNEITDIFVRSEYGTDGITGEEYEAFKEYYRNMFRCLRQYLGLRWIVKFFVL
ncbi:MAG: hypothetical protein LIO75_01925 [Lachnospiraceae bacterium]|nr:hypothetical protein [Lachnospiraceae bacterium]